MSQPQAPQPHVTLNVAGDDSRYLIHSRMEIVYILRAIQAKNTLITVYYNQDRDFYLSSLVHIDSDKGLVAFDRPAEPATLERVRVSERLVFVTMQDRVHVQFTTGAPAAAAHHGDPVFAAGLPKELLKLQRREYFRLTTPIANPLKCRLFLPGGESIDVTIVDISVGGIGIIGYEPNIELSPGSVYKACRIDLPDTGTVIASLEIRNAFEVTLKNGVSTKRSGCRFVDLSPNMQALIQRYITKLEREQRNRSLGQP